MVDLGNQTWRVLSSVKSKASMAQDVSWLTRAGSKKRRPVTLRIRRMKETLARFRACPGSCFQCCSSKDASHCNSEMRERGKIPINHEVVEKIKQEGSIEHATELRVRYSCVAVISPHFSSSSSFCLVSKPSASCYDKSVAKVTLLRDYCGG